MSLDVVHDIAPDVANGTLALSASMPQHLVISRRSSSVSAASEANDGARGHRIQDRGPTHCESPSRDGLTPWSFHRGYHGGCARLHSDVSATCVKRVSLPSLVHLEVLDQDRVSPAVRSFRQVCLRKSAKISHASRASFLRYSSIAKLLGKRRLLERYSRTSSSPRTMVSGPRNC